MDSDGVNNKDVFVVVVGGIIPIVDIIRKPSCVPPSKRTIVIFYFGIESSNR
jgi:hypothetical protein